MKKVLILCFVALPFLAVSCNRTPTKKIDFQPTTPVAKPQTWDERDGDSLDQADTLSKQGDSLSSAGKYADAITAYQQALGILQPIEPYYTDENEFESATKDWATDKKMDALGEVQGIANRIAVIDYSLSFAQRDITGVSNNLQDAIDSAKEAVQEKDKAVLFSGIEDKYNTNAGDSSALSLSQIFASSTEQTEASYLSQLGDLYKQYGANDLAVTTAKQAVDLYPDSDDETWYGVALVADRNVALGCQEIKAALKLDATNADAAKFKQEFCQ